MLRCANALLLRILSNLHKSIEIEVIKDDKQILQKVATGPWAGFIQVISSTTSAAKCW